MNQQQQFISQDPDPYQSHSLFICSPQLRTQFLDASDIHAFMALQEKIRPTLLKPHHLKERNLGDLHDHLSDRMPIFGTKTMDGKLVGFGLLTFLKNQESGKNLSGYPVADWQRATTAVAQTVCSDPDFKRKGISSDLLDSIFQTAAQNGMTRIISAIADDNRPSIAAFESAGYSVFARGIDPKLHYPKTFYQCRIGCNAA